MSHPAVLSVNQLPYAALRNHGWDPFIVVPSRWRHEYQPRAFAPEVLPELRQRVIARPVILAGRVQRHFYLSACARLIEKLRPDVAFIEAEPTSVSALQWSGPLSRRGIPFGIQAAENLDRHWPPPARAFRRRTLARTAFIAARSPAAAELVHRIAPSVPAPVIPHHVVTWTQRPSAPRREFVIGFAGRLVPAKGLNVLIDAAAGIDGAVLQVVGNGPSAEEIQRRARDRGVRLELDTSARHEDMADVYAGFDVLVLPSLTTPTWAEQFGRVLVESLWCGTPVVGSDSGEIPWVINETGGGIVFPEGNVEALREAIVLLRDSEPLRHQLADRGGARVRELFSLEAVASRLDEALRFACG